MNLHDNNPKSQFGTLKTPYRLMPTFPLALEAEVFALGAKKYGAHNWRETSVSSAVYFEAALRHLFAWYEGEDNDPESGVNHLAHVRACMGIVLDAKHHNRLINDRPTPIRPNESPWAVSSIPTNELDPNYTD